MNANLDLLRVCLGLAWENYRCAASRAERSRRRQQVREIIQKIRGYQDAWIRKELAIEVIKARPYGADLVLEVFARYGLAPTEAFLAELMGPADLSLLR